MQLHFYLIVSAIFIFIFLFIIYYNKSLENKLIIDAKNKINNLKERKNKLIISKIEKINQLSNLDEDIKRSIYTIKNSIYIKVLDDKLFFDYQIDLLIKDFYKSINNIPELKNNPDIIELKKGLLLLKFEIKKAIERYNYLLKEIVPS